MTRQIFVSLLAADIGPWVRSNGGYFCVGDSPSHPYAVLASGNIKSWACILEFAGDRQAGAELPGAMSRVSVNLYVGHTVDLRKDPGVWLYLDASPSAKALLSRLDVLSARLLTCVFKGEANDDDAYAEYAGAAPVTLPGTGIPLRAWRLTFEWPLRLDAAAADYRYLNATT